MPFHLSLIIFWQLFLTFFSLAHGELQTLKKISDGTNRPKGHPAVQLPGFCPHSSHLRIPGLCEGGFSPSSSKGQFFLPADEANTTFWGTVAPASLVYSFSLGSGGRFPPMLVEPKAYVTRQLESGNRGRQAPGV